MPSQEDYLDNLLKDMAENKEEQWPDIPGDLDAVDDLSSADNFDLEKALDAMEAMSMDELSDEADALTSEENSDAEDDIEIGTDFDAVSDLEAVSDLTEEDIEKLLEAGAETAEEVMVEDDFLNGASALDLPDEDVLKMLEESGDSDLQEIQELLGRSDRNEAVDDSIEELLQGQSEESDLEALILGEESEEDDSFPVEEKNRRAQEKREQAQAKRQQKKEQAAAKKAERKAAKEAAKAAKAAEKEKRAAEKPQKMKKSQPEEMPPEDVEEIPIEETDDELFDMSVLDSIVSEAGLDSETDEKSDMPEEAMDGLFADAEKESEDIFAAGVAEIPSEDAAEEVAEDNLGLGDIGDLFGTGDVDAALFGDEETSDFPDFIALDSESSDVFGETASEEKILEEVTKEKKGFFSKILDFLTEEDEDDGKKNENIKLSKENSDILDELDKESGKKKGKKNKKGKKEKPKEKQLSKEKKPKKQAKPKKEKPVRAVPVVPEKKLSFKKVFPILLIGISVGVLLFVFVNAATEYSDKKTARDAFYEGDYQTCYQNLHGKDLDETESVMYGKSESILYIRLWIREYEMFVAEGDEVKALDSLIQTVADYPDLYEYANRWNAGNEVAEGYARILNILLDKYGLTEAQVLAISEEPDDVEYTKMVIAVVNGTRFEKEEEQTPEQTPPPIQDDRQDVLPEEEGLGQDSFIDNQ